MAHAIEIFLGRADDLADAFRTLPFVGAVSLGRGMAATPLIGAVIDALGAEETAAERIMAAGARLSASGPVVHLRTDYFGGAGGKEAHAWVSGGKVFGAFDGDAAPLDPNLPETDAALDDAMKAAFGWPEDEAADAFEALSLGGWRHTDDMVAHALKARGLDKPLGVILAGGQARRMGGGDKGRLMIGAQSILGHVIENLVPQVAGIAINANGDPERFADLGLPVIPDGIGGFPGPLAGVLAGLEWAAEQGASHIVTVAADTPFFPGDLVPRLLIAADAEGKPIALARTPNGRHPTFGLWPTDLADDLRAAVASGTRKVVAWTDRHGAAMADFPAPAFDPFFNVNTPEDLAEAKRIWGVP